MTLSYALLFAEDEPNVIDVDMTRQCIELPKGDAEQVAEKRRTIPLREVEELAFSYRDLVKIDNLHGFVALQKLKLDCNRISKIENLSHLTNLTWLDLSFNKITTIEGLETLTKLTDLVLFNNQISELEGLDKLRNLHVLSIGENHITKLDKVMYLRQFKNLELLNLAGNPICREANYNTFIISHLKHLKFLDYTRIKAEDVAAANEHHQDEIIDLQERDEQQAEEEKQAAKAQVEAKLMQEANLKGVDSLFDNLTKDDPDWAKLAMVPGLVDNWSEVRDKFVLEKDQFKQYILDKHAEKRAEFEDWHATVQRACDEKDAAARERLLLFEKNKKHLEELDALKAHLMTLEVQMVEILEELLASFDRKYSEHVEANKQYMMAFFSTVRDLEGTFNNNLMQLAQKLFDEKYSVEGGGDDLDALPEEARVLMSDKDTLLTAVQSSHDLHTQKLDNLEDTLVNNEVNAANELVGKFTRWAYTRNRDRIIEIITHYERNAHELDVLLHGEQDDE